MEKIKLDPFISELLYEHDCVIIADFGGFVANYKSSYLHPVQHTLSPPSKKIAFNSSLKINDGLLASYIAESNSMTYQEACRWINKYVEESVNLLDTGKKLHIEKIGSLFYNPEKKIQFSPDEGTNYLLESFGLGTVHSPVIRRETVNKKPVMRFPETLPEQHKPKLTRRYSWKWIELVPAAAVLTLLFLNPSPVRNLSSNVAGFLPEINLSLPVKSGQPETRQVNVTATEPSSSEIPVTADTTTTIAADTFSQPLTFIKEPEENINEQPAEVKSTESSPAGETDVAGDEKYYIVAGCFRIEENAKLFHKELEGKGYPSEMIGKFKGLHVVTFQQASNEPEARMLMAKIKNDHSDAWVLRK